MQSYLPLLRTRHRLRNALRRLRNKPAIPEILSEAIADAIVAKNIKNYQKQKGLEDARLAHTVS